ncbi:MAG: S-adenosyl-l-methionine hydroxide adenosyltransferase family protein [Chitinophagaceae bacterium]|nr:S-adenosyl-l-methionine hydroxide adenosyltransferase family protein [Chitinophagaceae bacterium]
MLKKYLLAGMIAGLLFSCNGKQPDAVVIQTDFGEKDGAVSAMKGVAYEVDPALPLFDLTHEIPAYNIWEAAYRLEQTLPYWPAGTVFVSVVDPGVGTERKSIVAKTKSGHYIVTPDNGTLTLVAASQGIEAVREIDETINRREGSERSHTFYGRDVYVFTAARLAAKKISFEQIGAELKPPVVLIPFQQPELAENSISGNIPVLDIQYGNVWTNIPDSFVTKAGIQTGDTIDIQIVFKDSVVCSVRVPFVKSFGDVPEGNSLAYINSLLNLSFAINMGSFAERYGIKSGPGWSVTVRAKL